MTTSDQTTEDLNKAADTAQDDKSAEKQDKSDADVWAELEEEETQDDNGHDQDDDPDLDAGDNSASADSNDDPDPKDEATGSDSSDPSSQSDADEPETVEALRSQLATMEQKLRSSEGRATGQQRRAERLQAELDQAKAAAKKSSTQSKEDRKDRDDRLKEAAEEYGDVLGPLVDEVDELRQTADLVTDQTNLRIKSIEEDQKELLDTEWNNFTHHHPDGLKVVADDQQAFFSWVEDQPKAIRDIWERNADNIVDGEGAALLLTKYKLALAEAKTGSDPEPETKDPKKAIRDAQLDGANSRSTNSARPVVSDLPANESDPTAIWDEFERLDKRKKA